MKRGLLALLSGLMLLGTLAFPSDTYAEITTTTTTTPTRTLSVTGTGRIEVKPDTATISLGVTQLKPTPAEAYQAMSLDLNRIAESVQTTGIKEDQIQTGVFNLSAEYNWIQEKGQVLSGYRATTTLTITTSDLESVASLVQKAVESGANQLNGINFYVKDTDKLAQQALDLAVDDARAKAKQVADRLGARVGRVISVSIQDNGTPVYRGGGAEAKYSDALAPAAAPAPVYGGSTSFTATVHVVFEIE